MKYLFLLLFLVGLFSACTSEPENPDAMDLTIQLLGNPQCNGLKSGNTIVEPSASQSCLEYLFDQETGKLSLKHLNAGFNCCPDSLWCTVVYRNDSIIVQEFEKHVGCKCNCLYDLDLVIEGLVPGTYHLKLNEPYLGNQEPLILDLNLRSEKQGSSCVKRTIYPWGL